MKVIHRADKMLTTAFLIWLGHIGYTAQRNHEGLKFIHCVKNDEKNFPRDVVIFANGRLNKPAKKLFAEFSKHNPFENLNKFGEADA